MRYSKLVVFLVVVMAVVGALNLLIPDQAVAVRYVWTLSDDIELVSFTGDSEYAEAVGNHFENYTIIQFENDTIQIDNRDFHNGEIHPIVVDKNCSPDCPLVELTTNGNSANYSRSLTIRVNDERCIATISVTEVRDGEEVLSATYQGLINEIFTNHC